MRGGGALPLASPVVWSKNPKNHLGNGQIAFSRRADSFTSSCSLLTHPGGRP
jgi:hypothetical protein